ncbi:hypothetical protein pb186bvf_018216 [Paramecium bursaria]
MFVTIKLSGIVKPSPTFDLVSRPQSKKTIIQSLSDHLKKCKIFIPEDDDFYALFYCDGQVYVQISQQIIDKSSSITFYKLKLINYHSSQEKMKLIEQFNEFLSQQNKRIERRFKTLINDHYNKTQQNQEIILKIDENQKKIISQLKLQEESKYKELKEMQEKLNQLQQKQSNDQINVLEEINNLNLDIEQQFQILEKLQDYCLQNNLHTLSQEQYQQVISGQTNSSRQQKQFRVAQDTKQEQSKISSLPQLHNQQNIFKQRQFQQQNDQVLSPQGSQGLLKPRVPWRNNFQKQSSKISNK